MGFSLKTTKSILLSRSYLIYINTWLYEKTIFHYRKNSFCVLQEAKQREQAARRKQEREMHNQLKIQAERERQREREEEALSMARKAQQVTDIPYGYGSFKWLFVHFCGKSCILCVYTFIHRIIHMFFLSLVTRSYISSSCLLLHYVYARKNRMF